MATLQPVVFEISVPHGNVRVSEMSDGTWVAYLNTGVQYHPTPEAAVKSTADEYRKVADALDPLPDAVVDMIRGLVRAAELKEQADGGKIWDDACRIALEKARELGWGKDQVGTLGR